MPKRLILNSFSMNAVSHVFHGFWRRPDTRQTEFNDLEAWIELAQLLERGKFDALFVADILGVDASYKRAWTHPAGASLQLRQKGVDARSSEQRSGRLEHRDQRQPQRGAVGLKPD
jgi:alkanesulfonate monooxygenase SsuD/methylene tetrahydromethanopterin reductase-like flavin-dependent oxidoreductase (luciferase family)